MNRKEWRSWHRRLVREYREAHRDDVLTAGSFNRTKENLLSRSKYLGRNYAFTYNQRSEGRIPCRGDFYTPTSYFHTGVDTRGNGHIGYHYQNDVVRTQGDSFVCLPIVQESGTWGGYDFTRQRAADLRAAAQKALNAKILSYYAQWDALTDAVETKKTLGFLRETAGSFLEAGRAIASRDAHRFFQVFGIRPTRRRVRSFEKIWVYHYGSAESNATVISAFSDLWMKYRYGCMPLVYSMRDAIKALYTPSETYKYDFQCQVTLFDSVTRSQDSSCTGAGGLTLFSTVTGVHAGSVRMQAKFSFADSVRNRFLSSPIPDILKTVYEEVPFSWVVDWFYDISGYLGQLKLYDILGSVTVNVTEKGYVNYNHFMTGLKYPNPPMVISDLQFECSGYNSIRRHFRRTRGAISVQPPSLEMGLYTFKRDLDTAALAWQRTKIYLTHERPRSIKI